MKSSLLKYLVITAVIWKLY